MRMTFTRGDDLARVELRSEDGAIFTVTGMSAGEPVGRVFMGPGARQRAMHAGVHLAYGKGLPELGARSGDTIVGARAVLVVRSGVPTDAIYRKAG